MQQKLLIFDFDGTLANTFPFVISILNQLADEYNFNKITYGEEKFLQGMSSVELIKYLKVPVYRIPQVMGRVRFLMNESISSIKLFHGVSEVIIELKKKSYILALASSNSLQNIKNIMGSELYSNFAHRECGISLFGKSKRLKNIIKKYDFVNDAVYYIGDELRDIKAARTCRIKSVAVSWGYNNRDVLKKNNPDKLLDRVVDLLDI